MKNVQIKYPNKLKEFRKKCSLYQKDVAELMGLKSEDRMSRWEKGQSLPSVPNLFKLAKLYKVSIEDIYTELK